VCCIAVVSISVDEQCIFGDDKACIIYGFCCAESLNILQSTVSGLPTSFRCRSFLASMLQWSSGAGGTSSSIYRGMTGSWRLSVLSSVVVVVCCCCCFLRHCCASVMYQISSSSWQLLH